MEFSTLACSNVGVIECNPLGICSWDFELQGEGLRARCGFGWPTESGWIDVDGSSFAVNKQGFFSGKWELVRALRTMATAEKRSTFTRSFDIHTSSGQYTLEADSFATRTMFLRGPGGSATIEPAHVFTRRATIKGSYPDFETLCFAFWLTALTWRRAANNNTAAAG